MSRTKHIEHSLTQDSSGMFRAVVMKSRNGHHPICAAVYGEPEDGCLVRVHSRCVYSEVLGSKDCDCHEQLVQARELMCAEGGVLVYLEQEGRGSGLMAKARGYRYSQRTGLHTFASYQALKLPLDSRSYYDAATLLKRLKLQRIRLLTNNPAKIEQLRANGLQVERQELVVPVNGSAAAYLEAKRARGHLLPEPA